MDRRKFVSAFGGVAALGSLGGLAIVNGNARPDDEFTRRLRPGLTELVDPRFGARAMGRDRSELLASLSAKGVVSLEQGIDLNRLASLAEHEPLVSYQDFYYTQTELDLYSLALLVELG